MQIREQVNLQDYTTLKIGGEGRYYCAIKSKTDLKTALKWAQQKKVPVFVLGGGSNVVFTDAGYQGLVIHNQIPGFQVLSEDETSATLVIGAGENWDNVVKRTVELNLSGIEALSLIPGTAGATPIQNVGAYGQEISDTLLELTAYDLDRDEFTTLNNQECGFGYRDSVFKHGAKGRYIITSLTLQLSKSRLKAPFYPALAQYLLEHKVTNYSPASIRQAVIAIRQSKLPDPAKEANAGSFFKNPVIEKQLFSAIREHYPAVPGYPEGKNHVKIPAGWLIEQAGLKGASYPDATGPLCTYSVNALVVVNRGGASYQQLEEFRRFIVGAVEVRFGISLEQEPETVASK